MTKHLDLTDPQTQLILRAIQYKEKFCRIESYFKAKGAFRRYKYKKHLAFFEAGEKYKQRLFLCANRVGKTTAAGCELTYHLTGLYPDWWKGRIFKKPQDWWVCGKYSQTIRDILQSTLLGNVGEFGSGLIPKHLLDIDSMTNAKKSDTLITDFRVKHVSGSYSTVGFRSYDQGRKAFEGTERCIWLDEEPPLDVYQECLTRTLTRQNGDGESILMMTFTPLEGMSETVMGFLGEAGDFKEGEKGPGKYCTTATWDDVPHLTEKDKLELAASYPEYQRDARTKGIPQLGAGAVYPISPSKVFIDPIAIPEHFRRCYALDFGFQEPTAIVWLAIDPETDVVYAYAEHYLREQPPMVHAGVIKERDKIAGFRIPGVCDPSGGGSSTADGKHTAAIYRKEYEVNLLPAINSLEPGITKTMDMMIMNKIKIFNTLVNLKREYTLYRRNEKGKPIGDDHALDALRYGLMSGIKIAKSLTEVRRDQMLQEKVYESNNPIYYRDDYWLYT
jgi:phage terminase large subunit-like protein